MSLPTDYHRWYDHYYSNSTYLLVTEKYLHDNAKRLGLSKAKSIISIGAGEGSVDTYIMNNCTPELRRYIGVEPDKSRFDTLREATSTCTNVEVTLVNEGLQGWKGPTEPVDVIMLNHVLYFVPDYVSAIRQCYKWLKPDGSIIILQGYDDNIFIQMGKRQNSGPVHLHLINLDRIKKDLLEAGFQCIDGDKLAIHMTSNFSSEDLLLYFKMYITDLSDEKADVLVGSFREKMKSTKNEFLCTNGSFHITKPFM